MPSLVVLDWNAFLFAAAQEVLETMFFTSVYGISQGSATGNVLFSTLRFEGDPSGTVTIGISEGTVRPMAANFLGLEADEITSNQLEQVCSELANMVCGNVLSRTAADRTFRLTHPQTTQKMVSSGAIIVTFESIIVNLDIENGVFTSQIDFDSALHGQQEENSKLNAIV